MELEKILNALEEVQGMTDKAQEEEGNQYFKDQLGIAARNCQGAIHMVREAKRTLAEPTIPSGSAGDNSMELEKIVDALLKVEAMINEAVEESKNNRLKQQLNMAAGSCRMASSQIREVMRIQAQLAKQSDSA